MDHLIASWLDELEQLYPQCGNESTPATMQFSMVRKNIEGVLFPAPVTKRTRRDVENPSHHAHKEQRKEGLLHGIERARAQEVNTELSISQIDRYKIIVRLRTIQALDPDTESWAHKKLESLIKRIEEGEIRSQE